MDRNVPPGAAMLLDFIGSIEAPHGYDTIYGNNQHKMPKPLTTMTIDEVIAAGSGWTKNFGSSACGKLQFMKATLQRLKKVLGLTGKELLDGPMQDALGYQLLKERGYSKFVGGSLSRTAFGLALAQEWASFPALTATKGQKRSISRGQSYYAGDGVNKALVEPARVEAMLDKVKASEGQQTASPAPAKAAGAPVEPIVPQAAPEPVPVAADPIPVVPDPPTKETIATVQKRLADLGYNPGSDDGVMGPLTRGAILSFKNDNGLTPNDTIDEAFLTTLATASPRKMVPDRANATVGEVAAKVPEANVHWWTRLGSAILGGATTAAGAADYIAPATGYLSPVKDFVGEVPAYVWIGGVVALCAVLFVAAQYGAKKSQQAFQAGDRR